MVEPVETPGEQAPSVEPVEAAADLDPPWFELIDALEVAAKARPVDSEQTGESERTSEVGAAAADPDVVVVPVEDESGPAINDVPAGRRRRWRKRAGAPEVAEPAPLEPALLEPAPVDVAPVDVGTEPSVETEDGTAAATAEAMPRRRWWRRVPKEVSGDADADAGAAPGAEWIDPVEEPDDLDLIVDPAAAVALDELLDGVPETDEPAVRRDRRRARRERRRGGRRARGVPLAGDDDLPPVDPAAAVAENEDADLTPEPVALEPDPVVVLAPEREPEPEVVAAPEPEPEAAREPKPELTPDADLTMHVLEVPADAPAEFVRDFLRDVQHLVHGGVPTSDQVEAEQDRKAEDWLPEEWVPDREPTTRRARRRTEQPRALPVVRPPSAPQRRREKVRPKRATRLARYSLVVLLIGGAAALPWVVPEVPTWFASAVPETGDRPASSGPTILPAPTPTAPEPTPTAAPALENTQLAAAGRPLEVWVPRLKVRSPVVPISGQSGTLVPPDDAQILGWWQEGRGAGAKNGSTVVTGHTISTGGGAFDNLGQLTTGDRLRVRTSAGWITYAVERSRDYTVQELARNAEQIFELGGEGRLVMITCSDFNGEVYLSNAVVFATPVGDEPFVSPDEPGAEVPDGGLGRPWDEAEGNTGDDRSVQLTEKPF